MKSWIPVFIASFAAISADSLPSIPTWAGIHSMEMLNLTVEARFCKDNILSTLSGLDLDFPFCSACPAGIWCQNDVVLTSMRRNHVASTLIRHHFRTKCPLGV